MSRQALKNISAVHQAIDRHCSQSVTYDQFIRLAADVPLVIAPAQFTWTTFERVQPRPLHLTLAHAPRPTRHCAELQSALLRHAAAGPRRVRLAHALRRAHAAREDACRRRGFGAHGATAPYPASESAAVGGGTAFAAFPVPRAAT